MRESPSESLAKEDQSYIMSVQNEFSRFGVFEQPKPAVDYTISKRFQQKQTNRLATLRLRDLNVQQTTASTYSLNQFA